MTRVREWKPGDVAEVTMRHTDGSEQSWSPCMYDGENRGWVSGGSGRLYGDTGIWEIVTVRPLVVIDPEDREQVERLTQTMRANGWCGIDDEATSDMQRVLREFADPKPRIEEPTGLGAVVEDEAGIDWHRTREGRWISGDGLRSRGAGWPTLDVVRVLSEGVTP